MCQLLRSMLIPNCGSSCMQSHRRLNKRGCQHIKQLGMLVDLPTNAQAASVEAQATCCCLLSPAVPAAWFGAVGSHEVSYVLGQSSSFESGHFVSNLDRRFTGQVSSARRLLVHSRRRFSASGEPWAPQRPWLSDTPSRSPTVHAWS